MLFMRQGAWHFGVFPQRTLIFRAQLHILGHPSSALNGSNWRLPVQMAVSYDDRTATVLGSACRLRNTVTWSADFTLALSAWFHYDRSLLASGHIIPASTCTHYLLLLLRQNPTGIAACILFVAGCYIARSRNLYAIPTCEFDPRHAQYYEVFGRHSPEYTRKKTKVPALHCTRQHAGANRLLTPLQAHQEIGHVLLGVTEICGGLLVLVVGLDFYGRLYDGFGSGIGRILWPVYEQQTRVSL